MSTFEKITWLAVLALFIVAAFFSYQEYVEHHPGPNFEASLGQDFKIGTFATIVSVTSSNEIVTDCKPLQSVIIGVLHDIQGRLETLKTPPFPSPGADTFEVNETALALLCHETATIVLTDSGGSKLILEKVPFKRVVPPQGAPEDIGTDVRINATLVPAGTLVPNQPTTYGDVLIPDRFLDATTTP